MTKTENCNKNAFCAEQRKLAWERYIEGSSVSTTMVGVYDTNVFPYHHQIPLHDTEHNILRTLWEIYFSPSISGDDSYPKHQLYTWRTYGSPAHRLLAITLVATGPAAIRTSAKTNEICPTGAPFTSSFMLTNISSSLGSPGCNCNTTRIRSLSGNAASARHDRTVAIVSGSLSFDGAYLQ